MNQVPELTCRLPRVRKRIARCYELSYEGCQLGREWTLVHGEVNGRPHIGRIGHAWLELDGWVYDVVGDEVMLGEAYILKFGAQSSQKYTFREAITELLKYGHYGPWSDEPARCA